MGQRFVSLGDYVTTDTRLAALQTVSPQRASFQVPERYADQLKVGQQVSFRVASLPGREFTGKVDFVDPIVQLPGRTITVKARVPNPRRELQSGMFIEARLATAVRPDAVVIPEDAVIPLQGTNFVWVVNNGKATRRQVELGVRTPGFVEVKSGVENAEQVVVGGQERLAEGAPVQAKLVDRRPAGGQEDVGEAGRATAGHEGKALGSGPRAGSSARSRPGAARPAAGWARRRAPFPAPLPAGPSPADQRRVRRSKPSCSSSTCCGLGETDTAVSSSAAMRPISWRPCFAASTLICASNSAIFCRTLHRRDLPQIGGAVATRRA